MKNCKYTYYLLALLCITASSCINEDIINPSCIEKKAQISLTVKLSDAGTSESNNVSDKFTTKEEQYINDVAIYIFSKDNEFIEQVEYPKLTGTDGDATRTILGKLTADYSAHTTGIDIVVLANLQVRGVIPPTLTQGASTKEYLYSELTYSYTSGNEWQFTNNPKQYIPMWGTYSISGSINQPGINSGSLNLHRAIARVDVIIGDGGNGFTHFAPSGVKITRYNNEGYCATSSLEAPNVPQSAVQSTAINFSQPNENEQVYRLYIPEYKNIDAGSNVAQIELSGTLTIGDDSKVSKTYTLDFKSQGGSSAMNILRNHLYRFSITNIANEVEVSTELSYEVEQWETIEVSVPPFN